MVIATGFSLANNIVSSTLPGNILGCTRKIIQTHGFS